ncbi:Anaphase-promoting complex subunit 4 WD40 domain-containing protein [Plasmodiophora brassicae]|uniref:Anaphase-promoting complex subunit 4 WD40 domain-containing protein n=1 Tax=Plasmodiophora brassicae TaxID=37360 RepID=A0A0G4J2P9_PLABS|nr:hypothetical protein PBRA_002177 [Plasmodiophora brassicae]SPQ93159.1 unnamed protein product [Plasmodiophora brassicae]
MFPLSGKTGIVDWRADAEAAQGYVDYRRCDLMSMLGSSRFSMMSTGLPTIVDDNELMLPLTAPAPDPFGGDIVVVGTSNRTASKNIILAVNAGLLLKERDPTPDEFVVAVAPCHEYVQSVHWVENNALLAVHNSTATVFGIDNRYCINGHYSLTWPHTDEIRDVSFSSMYRGVFAAGGFDNILSLNDLDSGTACTCEAVRCDGVISSVRWHPSDAHCLCATLDDGRFLQFDTRTGMQVPVLVLDTQTLALNCHALYCVTNILFGYGDGSIVQYDARTGKCVDAVKDPFVSEIGDIKFGRGDREFVVCGESGSSLWFRTNSTAQLWSHTRSARNRPSGTRDSCASSAVFWGVRDTALQTDDTGIIGVHRFRPIL